MFGRPSRESDATRDAREARDISIENRVELGAHMHTCENNQRRIELEFTTVKTEISAVRHALGAQDKLFEDFKLQAEKRSNKMLWGIIFTVLTGAAQVALHFLPASLHL